MLRRVAYTLLPVGYMGILYYLSSIPSTELGRLGVKLPDKLLHGGAYALLALLLYVALRRGWHASSRAAGIWAWLLSVAYGVSDEYHQSFVPGRDPSIGDLVADAVGAAIALLVLALFSSLSGRSAGYHAGSRRRP